MTKALATKQDQGIADQFVSVIERAVTNPEVDTDKLRAILDMQMTIMDKQAAQAYSADMTACQAEMPMIVKNAVNNQTSSKYAKHEAICAAIKPVYTKAGFSLTFSQGKADQEDEIRTTCIVSHRLGHKETYYIDLPLDNKGIKGNENKTEIHGKGSTFSYGRRYLTLMIFDLATYDDNDGNAPKQEPHLTEAWQRAQEYYMACYEHKETIEAVKGALAEDDYETAAEALYELSNKELMAIRRAPTKGGIFTIEELKKMDPKHNPEWVSAKQHGIESNPEVDRSI